MGDIYCIMNHKKVKCSDNIRGLQAEANREYEDENRYRNKVDLSKSHQNITLVHSDDWRKSIHDAIAEAGLSADKDSILAISTVYTASPEWFESHPDKQEQLAYFKSCLAFHEMRFGKVFNAKIHFDETTPHMQLVSVPILEAPIVKNCWVCKEDGKEVKPDDKERWAKPRKRIQRKELDENGKPIMRIGLRGGYALGGKVKLSHLQTEFAEQVGKLHGMERGKCRIDSDEQVENKTALQHEIEELEKEKAELFEEAEKAVEDAKAKIAKQQEVAIDMMIDMYIDMGIPFQEDRYLDNQELMEAFLDLQVEQHEIELEKKKTGELKSAAQEELTRAAKSRRETDALKGVYEQKTNELDKLLPEVKKFVNEPPTVSEDADYRRKAYMESLKMPNGISAEEAYQKKLAREKKAEADKKAKADAYVKKAEQIREPSKQASPLAEVFRRADEVKESERRKNMDYSL